MQWILFALVQIVVLISVYSFFRWKQKKERGENKLRVQRDGNRELRELRTLRARSLNVPLAEMARPRGMADIIGQDDGLRALRAAMCGPNPQHVIIYGPPGIGKTCAARLVLEEAKLRPDSPFTSYSKFIEIDATCVRFDERSIADPLLGSVHDPIYQGAGAMGVQGIPQPKPGAVTRAHCGVLFLDEIGELHPVQMNKLLKVLEDRKVSFESAYYSKNNTNIPAHIHDIFQNGLPADFRLIGATTRSPDEMPQALRSRCVEIFFSPLSDRDLVKIAKNAADRVGIGIGENTLMECAAYAHSGRDAVNMVQLAGSVAQDEGRMNIESSDIEWVASTCRFTRKFKPRIAWSSRPGVCSGLGVSAYGGTVIEIECSVKRAAGSTGTVSILGAIEEEELDMRGKRVRRKSMAYASVRNVLGAFSRRLGIDCTKYDITFNIPGGVPMDGPSAGIALSAALMSALSGRAPKQGLALTGEVTLSGEVRGVGGIREKLQAAEEAGATLVLIPKSNSSQATGFNMKVVCVSDITEVMRLVFPTISQTTSEPIMQNIAAEGEVVSARTRE